jgi:ABC-2 type transport system permease protein
VALGGSAMLLFLTGAGTGIARAISAEDAGQLPRLIGAALAYVPALWVFASLAIALFGLVPRGAGFAWAAFGVLAFVGMMGPLLQLPAWTYDLSPLEHVPRLPVAELSVVPELALTAVAVALSVLGLFAFRRRDVRSH